MAILSDGTGTGNKAKVNAEKQLHVRGVAEGPLEEASPAGGAAYFFTSYAATSGDEIISIKNTESKEVLHITRILFSASADCRFRVFEVTSGTPAGTTLTYQNPNLGSTAIKSGTFFGNASVTGSLSGNPLFDIGVLAGTQEPLFLEGSLQLSNGDTIAITATGTNPTVYVTVIGFWHDDDAL